MKKIYQYLAILMFSISALIMVVVLKKSFALHDDWYSNYTYTLDETKSTITLSKYNGDDTQVTVPSTATINNKTYNVIVVGSETASQSLFSGKPITKVTFENGVKAGKSLNYLFYGCKNLEQIIFNNFDTTTTTSMQSMFHGDSLLKSIDVSSFNTKNVTTMESMFQGCSALDTLNMSSFTSENLTNIHYMFYNDSLLRKIYLGNFNFLYNTENEKYAYPFGRGTWKRLEDGKSYSIANLIYNSGTSDISGTYEFETSISEEMYANYNVTYKIDKITKIDEYEFSNNDIFMINNNSIYVKNLQTTSTNDYLVPGSVKLLIKNVVTDANNNKYNLRFTINNIHLYDLNIPEEGVDIFYHYIVGLVNEKMNFRSFNYKEDLKTGVYLDSPSAYDVTIEVINNDGDVQEGSYIFSVDDLDIPASTDKGREAIYQYSDNKGWGKYSEGINLLEGYDESTIKFFPHTFLKKTENRIYGYRYDEDTEFTEFYIKVNANKFKFTWTGETCGTVIMNKYQPSFVNILKQNTDGVNLPGAQLELYSGTNLIDSWTSTNQAHRLFLNPGHYILKEKSAPNNYIKASDLNFYVDIDGSLIVNNKKVDNVIIKNDKIPEPESVRVIVKYIDEETGEELDKITNNDKKQGDTYTSTAKEFDGYLLSKKPETETVTLNQDETILTYYYRKVVYVTTEVRGTGGTITGDEIVNYHQDSTPDKIVIVADKGHFIKKITINNKEIEISDKSKMILQNFINMEENKHIIVEFGDLLLDVPKTGLDTSLPILGIVSLLFGILFIILGRYKNKHNKKIVNY